MWWAFYSSSFFLVFAGSHFCAASAICPSAFQYLGTWHFRAVVSRKEADVLKFQAMDSMWFYMEEADNDTLLTTGHMRVWDSHRQSHLMGEVSGQGVFLFPLSDLMKKKCQQQVPTIIYSSRNERRLLLLLQLPNTRFRKSALYDVVMGRCSRLDNTK